MSVATVLIMAGGTGGHVFPALAVAHALRARGAAVVWLGSLNGMESRLVPTHGFPMQNVRVAGLRGKGMLTWVLAPFRLLSAIGQARSVIRRVRPSVVLGAGGFVSGPGGIAAWLARIPLLIHEQNAVAGMTNRWLARVATQVFEAFPGSFGARFKAQCIGNPVRTEIASIEAPEQRFAGRSGPIRLLVLGGSQGAQKLNAILPQALARIPSDARPTVRHQAGARGLEGAQRAYAESSVTAELVPFIDDMAQAYAWADVVICRAGALTIAELQAAGLGAVLVPFPAAVDDHQTANAQVLVRAGAARLIQERDLSANGLSLLIAELTRDRAKLLAMARIARGQAITDAAERLATACLALGRGAAAEPAR